MSNQPSHNHYKELANNIVGTWYNRVPGEVLTFSFLADLSSEAELTTIQHGECTKATYNLILTFDNKWYLQIWSTEGKKNGVYRIEILTANLLTVCNNENKVATYHRKVDYTFANQLLQDFTK